MSIQKKEIKSPYSGTKSAETRSAMSYSAPPDVSELPIGLCKRCFTMKHLVKTQKYLDESYNAGYEHGKAEERKNVLDEVGNNVSTYFTEWRNELEKAYKSKDKKPKVLVSFPIWLSEKLKSPLTDKEETTEEAVNRTAKQFSSLGRTLKK